MNEDYVKYHRNPKARKENASRLRVRRKLVKEGRVKPGDGKEIDHIDGNPMNNSKKNLRVISRHANRVKQ